MKLNEYPEQLTNAREVVEGNFIFSLYRDPSLYADYQKIIKIDEIDGDIRTEDGSFYYSMGLQMYKLGYQNFDNTSIYTFIQDNPVLKEGYESRLGYKTIEEIKSIINVENIDAYYDELVKNNMLLRLHDKGFDVLKEIDKFKRMTSEEVYDYFEYQLNNIMVDKVAKVEVCDLSKGYEKWIQDWDSGISVGYKIGYHLLNYHMAGIHKGNLILHVGGIGQGKSTSAILLYILPMIESGVDFCIIANEQDENEFRQMILASVLFNKVGYRKMNRQKFILGNFSQDDKENLQKATEWLENAEGKIHFAHLNDYNIKTVKKIIKKYSKIGVGAYLLDTMKPKDDSSERSWAEFSEVAKELFLIAHKEQVALIATAQLAGEAQKRKYLDLTCIGKSKAIAETAGQVILFRPLRQEEKDKLKAYSYKKGEDGKYTNVKTLIDLNPDKDYIALFVPKNRYGKANFVILYERNMDFNTLKELGYVDIDYDGFGR